MSIDDLFLLSVIFSGDFYDLIIYSYATRGETPDLNIDLESSVRPVEDGTLTWVFYNHGFDF